MKNLHHIPSGYSQRYDTFYVLCFDRENMPSVRYFIDIKTSKLFGYSIKTDNDVWECNLKYIKNTHKFKEMQRIYKNYKYTMTKFDYDIDMQANILAIGLENET